MVSFPSYILALIMLVAILEKTCVQVCLLLHQLLGSSHTIKQSNTLAIDKRHIIIYIQIVDHSINLHSTLFSGTLEGNYFLSGLLAHCIGVNRLWLLHYGGQGL